MTRVSGSKVDSRRKTEYGDFQTPIGLARTVCRFLRKAGAEPASIVEPTCGHGNFLVAALETFPGVRRVLGIELDPEYAAVARGAVAPFSGGCRVEVREADIFEVDGGAVVSDLPEPILILGNPPWVTSATLGRHGGKNRPSRGNATGLVGLDAVTGRSNFDISEWILRRLFSWLVGRDASLALLCKKSVARRVLAASWREGVGFLSAELRGIDARAEFGVAASAGLFRVRFGDRAVAERCPEFDSIDGTESTRTIGWRQGRLVADLPAHDRTKHLAGDRLTGWRSGVKHDCVGVFELKADGDRFVNGYGEEVEVEDEVLFPLLKSSALARGNGEEFKRWLLVPQRTTGEDPADLRQRAPRAWNYLERHRDRLDRRRSTIYRGRPRYSIFGVGPYTFAHWKVAISGLHDGLSFRVVGPHRGRPVVLDDTGYAFACVDRAEAETLGSLLGSEPAQVFYSSGLFDDAKRPVTAELLNRLDLAALGREIGLPARRVESLAVRQREGRSPTRS